MLNKEAMSGRSIFLDGAHSKTSCGKICIRKQNETDYTLSFTKDDSIREYVEARYLIVVSK